MEIEDDLTLFSLIILNISILILFSDNACTANCIHK